METIHPMYLETFLDLGTDWSEQPEQFAIISGYATTGEKWSAERNQRSDERLQKRLVEKGKWLRRITGYSPESGHAEPSWAVDLSFDEACDIGKEFLQDAIYYVERNNLFVSYCDSRRAKNLIGQFSLKIRPMSENVAQNINDDDLGYITQSSLIQFQGWTVGAVKNFLGERPDRWGTIHHFRNSPDRQSRLWSLKRIEAVEKTFAFQEWCKKKRKRNNTKKPQLLLDLRDAPRRSKEDLRSASNILKTPVVQLPEVFFDDVPSDIPITPPKESGFITVVEWPLRPGDTRIEAYFVGSDRARKNWVLWQNTMNDLVPFIPKYLSKNPIARISRQGISKEVASVFLLKAVWEFERDEWENSRFMMVSDCGILAPSCVYGIADLVWGDEEDSE